GILNHPPLALTASRYRATPQGVGMLIGIARGLILTTAALWVAGCSTSNSFSSLLGSKGPSAAASEAQAKAAPAEPNRPADETPTTAGTVPPPLGVSTS